MGLSLKSDRDLRLSTDTYQSEIFLARVSPNHRILLVDRIRRDRRVMIGDLEVPRHVPNVFLVEDVLGLGGRDPVRVRVESKLVRTSLLQA